VRFSPFFHTSSFPRTLCNFSLVINLKLVVISIFCTSYSEVFGEVLISPLLEIIGNELCLIISQITDANVPHENEGLCVANWQWWVLLQLVTT
jgi:hypothetical protein